MKVKLKPLNEQNKMFLISNFINCVVNSGSAGWGYEKKKLTVKEGPSNWLTQVIVTDHVFHVMQYFSPDGRSHLQDNNTTFHKSWGVTEWFDEYENDVNDRLHMTFVVIRSQPKW